MTWPSALAQRRPPWGWAAVTFGAGLVLWSTASPAAASAPPQAPQPPASLDDWLGAVEQSPTPSQLRRAAPDTEAALLAIAADGRRGRLVRLRAVAWLSRLASPRADEALAELAGRGAPELQATALLALVVGTAARRPSFASHHLGAALVAADPATRQAAASALGRWHTPRALRLLAGALRHERAPAVRKALQASVDRHQRAAAPARVPQKRNDSAAP